MNKKQFIGIALTVCLMSLVWILLTPVLFSEVNEESDITAAHPGFTAPEFSLQNLQNQRVSLLDYQGQPVLVFFWASWCSVCKRTMPGLQSIYEAYNPQGFEILAINTTYQDALPNAVNYFQTQGYTYTFLIEPDGEVSTNYRTHALPTAVLINTDGIVLDVIIGSGLNEGFLRARLDSIFAEIE